MASQEIEMEEGTKQQLQNNDTSEEEVIQKMRSVLKEPVGDGDCESIADEIKISIETANDAPVLPVSHVCEDIVTSSTSEGETRSVEFSEEKDAPEMSHRVYDFNMVKLKTLPRRMISREGGLLQFCSSQPKSHLFAWSLMTVSVVACMIVVILYFALSQ